VIRLQWAKYMGKYLKPMVVKQRGEERRREERKGLSLLDPLLDKLHIISSRASLSEKCSEPAPNLDRQLEQERKREKKTETENGEEKAG